MMDSHILSDVDSLAAATTKGALRWEQISNTNCLVSHFNKKKYILCRHIFWTNRKAISLNYLDQDNSMVGDLNSWETGQPDFGKLDDLYELAILQAVNKTIQA
jgi:hypothetical protein